MVERICPSCSEGNLLDARFCARCGAPLERQMLARRSDAPLVIAGKTLPVTWKQLGRTVAISAAALAAEAGLAWLRGRIEAGSAPTRAISPAKRAITPPSDDASIVTIISQRIVEIWDSGDGRRKIVEHSFWRRIDE
jgi:phage tail protein X